MMLDRRIWLSIAAVILVILSFTRAIDDIGTQNTEDALVRALATFAVARALNGVISVAQGTEVAIEPAGVGVILTPGEILDPVNDLVERFSMVMLVSSASLGVLNILLSISAWIWLSVVFTLAVFAALYFHWKSAESSRLTVFIMRLAMLLLILRFAAPLIAISNEIIYQQFLEPRYETALAELENTKKEIQQINTEVAEVEPVSDSFLERARAHLSSTVDSIKQSLDVEDNMQRYREAADKASRHTIDLIVIFVFQTIILPILFIWIIWQLMKWVIVATSPYK